MRSRKVLFTFAAPLPVESQISLAASFILGFLIAVFIIVDLTTLFWWWREQRRTSPTSQSTRVFAERLKRVLGITMILSAIFILNLLVYNNILGT